MGLFSFLKDIPIVSDIVGGATKAAGKVVDEVGGGLGLGGVERYGARMQNSPIDAFGEFAPALLAAYYGGPMLFSSGGAAPTAGATLGYGGLGETAAFASGATPGTYGGLGLTESLAAGGSLPAFDAMGAMSLGASGGLNPLLMGLDGGASFGMPATAGAFGGSGGFDAMSYLSRMWKSPMGRMALLRAGSGLYANRQMRKLDRRLRDTDPTQTPGYRAGERAIIRRASAGGYADSTRMLAELSDYGQQNYDRFAANERANYQARVGGLMSEMNTLGMLSLGLGF